MQIPRERLTSEYEEHLCRFDVDSLERTEEVVYGLGPDFRLGYVNPGWETFAAANGATDLTPHVIGRILFDAMTPPLRGFYEGKYLEVMKTGTPFECSFECPSPEQRRTFRMRVLPSGVGGLLITNALVVTAPHAEPGTVSHVWLADRYRDHRGVIVQCCNCRRVRRVTDEHTWDFVPELVRAVRTDVSHGICPPCEHALY